MRLLHYGLGSNTGGIETYLLSLTKALVDSGIESHFLYNISEEPAFYAELRELGAVFHGFTPRSGGPNRSKTELKQIVFENEFDIYHHHAASASYITPLQFALRAGIPSIWHSHNAGPAPSRRSTILDRMNKKRLPWDSITRIAVSSKAGNWAFGSQAFEVIPNGIDLQAFAHNPEMRAELRADLQISPTSFVLGQIGTLSRVKNHSFTLNIFTELLSLIPDSHLVLAGDGPLLSTIEEMSQYLGIRERVHFLKQRNDVVAVLSALDALVHPSYSESFSLVALEAQASGVLSFFSEAVPKEVVVAPNAFRYSIASGEGEWAKAIAERLGMKRSRNIAILERAGYDLTKNVDSILKMYKNIQLK